MFSTSNESKSLLEKWIKTAGSKSQSGRADDRVLSLVFNSYKMSMKNKEVVKNYPDYSNLSVSNTVSTIIQSYTHYINEKVWFKKN